MRLNVVSCSIHESAKEEVTSSAKASNDRLLIVTLGLVCVMLYYGLERTTK